MIKSNEGTKFKKKQWKWKTVKLAKINKKVVKINNNVTKSSKKIGHGRSLYLKYDVEVDVRRVGRIDVNIELRRKKYTCTSTYEREWFNSNPLAKQMVFDLVLVATMDLDWFWMLVPSTMFVSIGDETKVICLLCEQHTKCTWMGVHRNVDEK